MPPRQPRMSAAGMLGSAGCRTFVVDGVPSGHQPGLPTGQPGRLSTEPRPRMPAGPRLGRCPSASTIAPIWLQADLAPRLSSGTSSGTGCSRKPSRQGCRDERRCDFPGQRGAAQRPDLRSVRQQVRQRGAAEASIPVPVLCNRYRPEYEGSQRGGAVQLVRVATALLIAVLVLCGCWANEPEPQPVPTTRPPSPPRTGRLLPGEEVEGLCMTQNRSHQAEFIPCNEKPRPGFLLLGRVVRAVPEPPDYRVGTATTVRSYCPAGTDGVRSGLPSGQIGVLCLDTKLAHGNTRP
jgi:hypothetical protein